MMFLNIRIGTTARRIVRNCVDWRYFIMRTVFLAKCILCEHEAAAKYFFFLDGILQAMVFRGNFWWSMKLCRVVLITANTWNTTRNFIDNSNTHRLRINFLFRWLSPDESDTSKIDDNCCSHRAESAEPHTSIEQDGDCLQFEICSASWSRKFLRFGAPWLCQNCWALTACRTGSPGLLVPLQQAVARPRQCGR